MADTWVGLLVNLKSGGVALVVSAAPDGRSIEVQKGACHGDGTFVSDGSPLATFVDDGPVPATSDVVTLIPVKKKDRVKVIQGHDQIEAGARGTLIGIDGDDVIIKVDSRSSLAVLPLACLGKLADRNPPPPAMA